MARRSRSGPGSPAPAGRSARSIVGFLLTGWWIFPSFWWGAAFVVNVVVSVVVMVAVAVFAPRSKDDSATPLDPFGAALSLVGVGALLYGIIEGPEQGWGDSSVVGAFVVAAVMLLIFMWWERRTEHPMLPMPYFRDRRFSTGSGIITFGFLVMFGFFFLVDAVLPVRARLLAAEGRHRHAAVRADDDRRRPAQRRPGRSGSG